MDGYPAADGLRRRRARQEANGEILPAAPVAIPQQHEARNTRNPRTVSQSFKLVRLYCFVSIILFILAIVSPMEPVTSSAGRRVFYRDPNGGSSGSLQSGLDRNDEDPFNFIKAIQEVFAGPRGEKSFKPHKQKQAPAWIRWLLPPTQKIERVVEKKSDVILRYLKSLIDPTLLNPSPNTPTDIIDKILKSTPSLIVVANFLLVMTYLIHGAVADFFLGVRRDADGETARWAGRERLGGFLVFKLLLISAVVAPDTLDMLILLSWYTLLSFLRSLAALASATTSHTSLAGQPPKPGVLKLLILVLASNVLAAAVCVGLFHGAGWGMVFLLTCDCAALTVDAICYILRHVGQGLENQHSSRISEIEERQLAIYELRHEVEENEETKLDENDLERLMEESRLLDRRMEVLDAINVKRCEVLDNVVFFLQLLAYALTICHFLHIWSLHGLQFTLIDGVIALHLHSAFSAAGKKITERQNLHRIARDLNGLFKDATEMELRKASATGDMCCICMGTMSTGSIKKVGCGHMYHTHCLREVVERARSIEAARCPLCRASVLDGTHPETSRNAATPTNDGAQAANNNNSGELTDTPENDLDREAIPVAANANNNAVADQALFRFSTEGILPAWLPLPAFSFEVVRRPQIGANAAQGTAQDPRQRQSLLRRILLLSGTISLSPEEEALAMDQLVDMFPQYDRADLLRELRSRGSAEDVAESVLLGLFVGVARGGGGGVVANNAPPPAAANAAAVQEERRLNDEAAGWERVGAIAQELREDEGGNNENRQDDGVRYVSDVDEDDQSYYDAPIVRS